MRRDPRALLLALGFLLAGCSSVPERPAVVEPVTTGEPAGTKPRTSAVEEAPLRALLAYYASNSRAPAQPPRDRPPPSDPYLQMQQAIQFGQARPPDLPRALGLLERTLKSAHPAAANLQPLARLLHEQYGERLRLEQQLREAQRRGDLLQEKIDALSAIERSLPSRTLLAPAPQGNQESAR